MSIYDNLQRLVTAKTNIANAITEMGGTVNTGDGFEAFSADIATIPTGLLENELPIHVDDINISPSSAVSSISKTNTLYVIDFIPITNSTDTSRLVNAGAYIDWSADISWNLTSNASLLNIKCGFGISQYPNSLQTYFSNYLNINVNPTMMISQSLYWYAGSRTIHYQSTITGSGQYILFKIIATANSGTIQKPSPSLSASNISGKIVIPTS